MPGGDKNIIPGDNPKPFTSENQPKNRRKSTKFLTELLIKGLKGKQDVIIEGIDIVTGKKTKVKVSNPNQNLLVRALLKQAAKGNVLAIREVFDRIEGKVTQPISVPPEEDVDVSLDL